MAPEWFYTSRGQKSGPVSSKELKRLATQGVLLPTDLLWKEGMKDWLPASKAKNLFANESSGTGGDPAGQQPPPQDSLSTSEPANATEAPVTLGARMQNAARVTALKAEQAKLTNVSLPAACLALGRHLYAGRLMTEGFPDLYQQLDGLQAQVDAATKRAAEATGANLSEKAKALATKAAELAKVKAAEVQQLSLLKRLGQAACEGQRNDSIPAEMLAGIHALRKRLAEINAALLLSVTPAPGSVSPGPTIGSDGRANRSWMRGIKWIGASLALFSLLGLVFGSRKSQTTQQIATAESAHSRSANTAVSRLENNTLRSVDGAVANQTEVSRPDIRDEYAAQPRGKEQGVSELPEDIRKHIEAEVKATEQQQRDAEAAWRQQDNDVADEDRKREADTSNRTVSGNDDQVEWKIEQKGGVEIKRSYHKNGQLAAEFFYKNGKREGLARTWHENGQQKSEQPYRNDRMHGRARCWWPNGKVVTDETFKDGVREGLYQDWNEDGVLTTKGTRRNGEWDGRFQKFWDNGKPQLDVMMSEGKENGVKTVWYENGMKEEVSYWKSGQEDGSHESWKKDGTLFKKGQKSKGEWEGPLYMYWPNGKKSFECTFKAGQRVGLLKDWDEGGQLREESNWKDGKRDGRCRIWSAKGRILLDRKYNDDEAEPSPVVQQVLDAHERQGYEFTKVNTEKLDLLTQVVGHAVGIKQKGADYDVVCVLDVMPTAADKLEQGGLDAFRVMQMLTINANRILLTAANGSLARRLLSGQYVFYSAVVVVGGEQAFVPLSSDGKTSPNCKFSQFRVGKSVYSVGMDIIALPSSDAEIKTALFFVTGGDSL
jgi:antitoxin component YwqK of YwqJK toxin-antitoxin module